MKKMLMSALFFGLVLASGSALASKTVVKSQSTETMPVAEKDVVAVEALTVTEKENKKPSCSVDKKCIKTEAKEGGPKKHEHGSKHIHDKHKEHSEH